VPHLDLVLAELQLALSQALSEVRFVDLPPSYHDAGEDAVLHSLYFFWRELDRRLFVEHGEAT